MLISYYPMIHNIQLLNLDVNFAVALALHLKVLKLKKREILYREDDPSEESISCIYSNPYHIYVVYFICKGLVSLITEEGDGIYSFVQGTYFGELETFQKVICFGV